MAGTPKWCICGLLNCAVFCFFLNAAKHTHTHTQCTGHMGLNSHAPDGRGSANQLAAGTIHGLLSQSEIKPMSLGDTPPIINIMHTHSHGYSQTIAHSLSSSRP